MSEAAPFFPDPPSQLTGQALRSWAADNALQGVSLGSVLQNWAQFTPQTALSLPAMTQSNSNSRTCKSAGRA